jgi:hypothetical protein
LQALGVNTVEKGLDDVAHKEDLLRRMESSANLKA